MAGRKQSSFDNQNADKLGAKDELVSIGANQGNPYAAKASDFPDGKTGADVATGQGSGATYDNPKGGGYDSLVGQNKNQEGPRRAEADMEGGNGTDDSMSERASLVGKNFSVSRNDGESSSQLQSPSIPESVDLREGCIHVSGASRSRVGEVPDRQVRLG